jgi:hypothetical protein
MSNGETKVNQKDGKANEQKVIPKDIWTKFEEYWDKTDYPKLTATDIKKHLSDGKYLFVPLPKEITTKLEADIWHMRMRVLVERNGVVSFSGDKTTLEELFGSEPISKKAVNEKFREYLKKKGK